jgi:hypothetical protein
MLKEVRSEITPPANNAGAIVGDFLNRNMRNILVVDDQVDKRNNMQALPVREPWGDLVVRYEPDTERIFILRTALKEFCVNRQITFNDLLAALNKDKSFINNVRTRIDIGTDMHAPPVEVLEFDALKLGVTPTAPTTVSDVDVD